MAGKQSLLILSVLFCALLSEANPKEFLDKNYEPLKKKLNRLVEDCIANPKITGKKPTEEELKYKEALKKKLSGMIKLFDTQVKEPYIANMSVDTKAPLCPTAESLQKFANFKALINLGAKHLPTVIDPARKEALEKFEKMLDDKDNRAALKAGALKEIKKRVLAEAPKIAEQRRVAGLRDFMSRQDTARKSALGADGAHVSDYTYDPFFEKKSYEMKAEGLRKFNFDAETQKQLLIHFGEPGPNGKRVLGKKGYEKILNMHLKSLGLQGVCDRKGITDAFAGVPKFLDKMQKEIAAHETKLKTAQTAATCKADSTRKPAEAAPAVP